MVSSRTVLLQPNRRRPYAQLLIDGEPAYQLTPSDVLWAARAAAFEGGEPADVLWTLAQRYVTARAHYPTFGAFAQAFSQPINPDWRRDGSHCHPGGDFERTAHCSEERLARRDHAAGAGWGMLWRMHAEAAHAAVLWANAQLDNPVPRATNFADPTVAQGYLNRNPDAELLLRRGNWFIAEPHSRHWPRDYVTLRSPDGAWAGPRILAEPEALKQALASFWGAVVQPKV